MIPNRDKERKYMFKKAEAEMKNPKKVKMGRKSKAQGGAFELRTRKDLEEKGFIVSKWQNNVEFDFEADDFYKVPRGTTASLKPAKPKMVFNPAIKRMIPQGMSGGFPDFVCFRKTAGGYIHGSKAVDILNKSNCDYSETRDTYDVIGVESKLTGTLDKLEKQKCKWYLGEGIFSKILVSKKLKIKNKIVVEYIDFVDIEKRMKEKPSGHSKKQNETENHSKKQNEKLGHRKQDDKYFRRLNETKNETKKMYLLRKDDKPKEQIGNV